jgi:hypothetical protein
MSFMPEVGHRLAVTQKRNVSLRRLFALGAVQWGTVTHPGRDRAQPLSRMRANVALEPYGSLPASAFQRPAACLLKPVAHRTNAAAGPLLR